MFAQAAGWRTAVTTPDSWRSIPGWNPCRRTQKSATLTPPLTLENTKTANGVSVRCTDWLADVMSINLENPETVLGMVDAAANCVAQIRLALMVGDKTRAMHAVEQAERLLFNATCKIEETESANSGMNDSKSH